MKKKIEKFPLSVHLILELDDKILFIKRKNTGYEDGKYSLPAGKVEKNESVYDAIVRETREEIGIDILKDEVEIIHVLHRRGDDYGRIDYFFKTSKWRGKVFNAEPDKCDEVKWMIGNEAYVEYIPYIRTVLKLIYEKKFFSIIGWDANREEV